MKLERMLRGIAGAIVLISLGLAHFHSPYWFLLTVFVGLNLFQSGFTNWCPMKSVLQWCGMKSCEQEIDELKKQSASGDR